jgi:two-component system chemotaxis sensor kinase CheA
MSIDISQFHDVFFEESFEGLDAMESGLLNLSEGTPDVEVINTIFRAAHSIKGGAGTFGFVNVSEFTHVMETLLDEMRNGDREVTGESTNLLLDAVDVLREMLTAVQQKTETDDQRIEDVRSQLEAMLNEGGVESPSDSVASTESSDDTNSEKPSGWKIEFKPHTHLLQTGNDPVRMFKELEALGKLTVVCDDSKLPAFSELEPEDSYLNWSLTLEGEASKDDVLEVFEWVDDDCDLSIEPLGSVASETSESTDTEEQDDVVDIAPAKEKVVVQPVEPAVAPQPVAAAPAAPVAK